MNNVVFHIDKENGVVVAVLKCDPYELLSITNNTIYKFRNDHREGSITCTPDWGFPDLNREYVGIARCSENDEFDEEFGKRLALARAKAKKADAMQKNFFKVVEWLDDFNYFMGKKYDSLYRNWIELLKDKDALLEQADSGI